tara:strand:- start:1458 stop:3452 length:1995 start_codon:yes stop_codon:yes gene_type:complete
MQEQNRTFLFLDGFFCILYCIFAAIVINFGDANAVVDGEAKSHFTIYNHGSMSAGGTLVIALVPFILLRAAIDFWEISERAGGYAPELKKALKKALEIDSKIKTVENQPYTSVQETEPGEDLKGKAKSVFDALKDDLIGTYDTGTAVEAYNKPNRNEQNIWRNQITGIAIILCGLLLGVVTTYKHIAESPHEFGLCLADDGTKEDTNSQNCKDDIKALFKSSIIFHEDFKQCPAGGAARWEGENFEDYVSLGLTHRLTNDETHTPWENCYQGLKQENKTQTCKLLSKPGNKKMKADQSGVEADPILVECQPIVWSRNADNTLYLQKYMEADRPVARNYHPKMVERCDVNQECVEIVAAAGATQTPLTRLVTGADVAASAEETLATAKREEISAKDNPYICLPRPGAIAVAPAVSTNPTDGTQCIPGAHLYLFNPETKYAHLFNVSRPYGKNDDKREMDWALDTTLAQLVFFVVLAFRGLDLIIDFEFSGCLQSQRNSYLNEGSDGIAPKLLDGIGNGSRIAIVIVFLVITLGTLIHGRYQIINENIFIAYEGWDPARAQGKPETIALHFNGDTFSGLNWAVIILVGCHLLLAILASQAQPAAQNGLEIFLITQKPFVRSFIATVILALLSVNVGQMAVFNHEITFLTCALVSYYIVDSVGANFL